MALMLTVALQIGIAAACTLLIWLLTVKVLPKITRRSASSFDDFILKCIADLAIPIGLVIALTLIRDDLQLNPEIDTAYVGSVRLIAVVVAVRFINRVAGRFMQGVVRRTPNEELQILWISLQPLLRALTWIVGALVYLQSLGMPLAAIWALLSAGGIGLGLALKEPAMELFAYLMILLDRPFRVGEFINIDSTWATVEKIGVRSTRLRNIRGEIVVMSNSALTTGVISNFADMPRRRIIYSIGVTYNTNIEVLKIVPELVSAVINKTENATFDRCHFVEFADSSLNFEIVYYIETNNYTTAMDAQQYVNIGIMEKFKERGIQFAFPTQTIYLKNGKSTEE